MTTQPMDRLKDVSLQLVRNVGTKALDSANDSLDGLTDKLNDLGQGGGVAGKAVAKAGEAKAKGDNPVTGGIKGAFSEVKDKVTGGGGGSGGGKPTKSTNITESIDIGVPVSVAYNAWTEFGSFPDFMKKVENVEAEEDTKLTWKAQIFWSHRTWEATITEQVPDKRIVWRSQGEKGHVDGAVTFHELGPELTRVIVVLEYYPQGFFERTGNLWRAQGRRARLELKHFRRHVMTRTILEADEVEGWRGVIEDGEVVEDHEEHVQREQEEQDEGEEPEDEYDDEGEEPEDEYDEPEDEYEDEGEEEEPEDEYEDEGEEEEPEDEYEDLEEEPEDEYEDLEEEPEDEYEDLDEEPEDEYEDDEEEPEEDERASA